MWFANFCSFHRLSFHFIDGFFLLRRRFWVWCVLTSLFLQFLPLLLMTELFELLVFWKAILYQLLYLLLSSPILTKRHRLAEWIQKQNYYICCLQETHFSPWDTYRLKVRGWKKIFHANGNQAGLEILISEKIDLKIKTIIRSKEWSNDQGISPRKDITILTIYVPNIRTPQYIR